MKRTVSDEIKSTLSGLYLQISHGIKPEKKFDAFSAKFYIKELRRVADRLVELADKLEKEEKANHIEKFKAAVNDPNFAYCTIGHPVSPDMVNVYHRGDGPTGVGMATQIRKDEEGVMEFLKEKKITPSYGATYGIG